MLDWYQPCQTEYHEDGCQCSKVYTAVGMTSGNIAEKNVCVWVIFLLIFNIPSTRPTLAAESLEAPMLCGAEVAGTGTQWLHVRIGHVLDKDKTMASDKRETAKKEGKKKRYYIQKTFVAKTTLSSDTTDCIISRSLAQGLHTYITDVQGQRVAANKDLSREQPTGWVKYYFWCLSSKRKR